MKEGRGGEEKEEGRRRRQGGRRATCALSICMLRAMALAIE